RRRHTRFSRDWSSDVCSSDLVVVLVAIILFERHGDAFLRLSFFVVLATIGILVVASVAMPSASIRRSLFFANPNQLGYHALLSRSEERRVGTEWGSARGGDGE